MRFIESKHPGVTVVDTGVGPDANYEVERTVMLPPDTRATTADLEALLTVEAVPDPQTAYSRDFAQFKDAAA